jgi:hypothetical protein
VYLAGVKRQYGAAPGSAMVTDVLRHLSQQPAETSRPVSARDPEY